MIDKLGHPIRKGDTVLTSSYRSPSISEITKVLKVNKKTVRVEVSGYYWDWGKNSKWTRSKVTKVVNRKPDKFIVIDAQLRNNRSKYPENCV